MHSTSLLAKAEFFLRCDLHEEIGYVDYVREHATRDPATIRLLLENKSLWDVGRDPLTVFETWTALTQRYILYFFLTRRGAKLPSLVVSDGLFNLSFDPTPDGSHLAGLPLMLMGAAARAAACAGYEGHSPVLPLLTTEPANANLHPDYLIAHDYLSGTARLRPFRETLSDFPHVTALWAIEDTTHG